MRSRQQVAADAMRDRRRRRRASAMRPATSRCAVASERAARTITALGQRVRRQRTARASAPVGRARSMPRWSPAGLPSNGVATPCPIAQLELLVGERQRVDERLLRRLRGSTPATARGRRSPRCRRADRRATSSGARSRPTTPAWPRGGGSRGDRAAAPRPRRVDRG